MKITTEIPISRKFKNKYLSKISNDFKNNIFLNSLIKTYETKLEDEQDSSLSALGDYTKIINVMLEDLNKISTNKIDLGFSYEEMKQNLIAVLWNASDYTKPELRNIKDKSEKLIKTFDVIYVEPDVMSFVKKNEKEYILKMTEVCHKILISKDDYKVSMDKLYKEINKRKEQIYSHFKNLNSKLSLKKELEYEACIKLKETALQKIERDSTRRGNQKDCFENLKDLIRCRCTISTLDEMKRIFDYLENEHDILQVKNALDRENVPTVYIVYKLLDESVLPPVEFQIIYKERNHHIHDFYDLARLENDKEFETWAIYNISKLFPNEYIEITKKADIEKKKEENLRKQSGQLDKLVKQRTDDFQNEKLKGFTPAYSIIYKGLNIEATCKNYNCTAFNKRVWVQKGFGPFNINTECYNSPCPLCKHDTQDANNSGFYLCKYTIEGKRRNNDGCIEKFSQKKKADLKDNFVTFEEDGHEKDWLYLNIKTEEL